MKGASWTTLALATATLTSCAAGTIDLPEPPMTDETEAVVAAYQSPTGTVDVAHIDMQLNRAEARLEQLHLSWLPDLVSDALIGLEKRLNDGELPTDPGATSKESDPKISAAVTLHRICHGWSDPPGPPDAATNGTIDLTAVIGGSELRRDIWGVATNCRTLVSPSDGGPQEMGFIDGTLILKLEGALPRQPGDLAVLFLLQGRLETSSDDNVVGNDVKSADLDFLIQNGEISFRLPVEDGDIIVTAGLTSLTLNGRNGTFTCELGSHDCH